MNRYQILKNPDRDPVTSDKDEHFCLYCYEYMAACLQPKYDLSGCDKGREVTDYDERTGFIKKFGT